MGTGNYIKIPHDGTITEEIENLAVVLLGHFSVDGTPTQGIWGKKKKKD